MVKQSFQQGDIVIIDFDPSSGSEIQKRRPAVVVSNATFNASSVLRLVCPITSTKRLYSVPMPSDSSFHGYILLQQIKSMDLSARGAKVVGRLDVDTLDYVTSVLKLLF